MQEIRIKAEDEQLFVTEGVTKLVLDMEERGQPYEIDWAKVKTVAALREILKAANLGVIYFAPGTDVTKQPLYKYLKSADSVPLQ